MTYRKAEYYSPYELPRPFIVWLLIGLAQLSELGMQRQSVYRPSMSGISKLLSQKEYVGTQAPGEVQRL